MAVIKEVPVRANGSTVLIPVVTQGSSILPSKVRVRIAGQTGELPLVHTNDNRASKIRVRQGGATYCVAKDVRTELSYSPGSRLRYDTASSGTWSAQVGTTYFNRVTRIEAQVRLGAEVHCSRFGFTSPYHSATTTAWISVSGTQSATSSSTGIYIGDNHNIMNSSWSTGWAYRTDTLVLDLAPGSYTLTVHMRLTCANGGHSSAGASGLVEVQSWKEIALG